MYCDFKVTYWERIEIPTGKEKEFIEKLKTKEIESVDDAYGFFGGEVDTCEILRPKDNNGCSTIELYTDPRKEDHDKINSPEMIWCNGNQ
jgi:hypothetical protein